MTQAIDDSSDAKTATEAPENDQGQFAEALDVAELAAAEAGVSVEALLTELIGDAAEEDAAPAADGDREKVLASARVVPIAGVHAGRFQSRLEFHEDDLERLAISVADKGILQPLLVRSHPDREGDYELIAGERRWRAAQRAGLAMVPVIVVPFSDREAMEVGLLENLQRRDLTPLEEAGGYRRLMNEFSRTKEDLARVVGRSRSHVSNTLRLLALSDEIKALLQEGNLSAGHGRALLMAENPVALARRAVAENLSVRELERLVQAQRGGDAAPSDKANKDANLVALEQSLGSFLGLKVRIAPRRRGGALTVKYNSTEQLGALLTKLGYPHRR